MLACARVCSITVEHSPLENILIAGNGFNVDVVC